MRRPAIFVGAFAACAVGVIFARLSTMCGVVGGLSFALGFSGLVGAILARLEIEFREHGLWLSRSRGLGSVLGYDSLTSVRLLDGWHRKLKQRTRWLEIRSTAAVMKIELVATELPDDFDAIVDELGKHATITG